MMLVKRLVLYILFQFAFLAMSAQYTLKGVISDADGNFMQGVIITAQHENKVVSYTFSDSRGAYEIVCSTPFSQADFSLMGFRRVVFTPDWITSSAMVYNPVMVESAIALPSVTIKPEAVTVKGDTVTYDTSFYTKREDSSIGEVLARIPFVSVTSSGQVQVKGVNVNKVYIEDMDLLGGRYGLAVNNIKPDDVASVSLYYNHQPVKVLQDVVSSEQAAINIKLKEKSKAKWLYSLEGAGAPELYSADADMMRFGSSNQTMIIGKMNNTGVDVITETRQQNVSANKKWYSLSDLKSGGVDDLMKVRELNLPIKSDLYSHNNTKALSVANMNKLTSGAELKESVVLGYERTGVGQITNEIISGSDTVIVQSDSLMDRMVFRLAEGDVAYVSNKENSYFENQLSFKVYSNEASSVLKSNYGGYAISYDLPKLILNDDYKIVRRKNGKVSQLYGNLHYSNVEQQMVSQMTQNFDTDNFRATVNSAFSMKKGHSTFSYEPGAGVSYNSFKSWIDQGDETMCNDLSLFTLQPYLDFRWNYKLSGLEFDLSLPVNLRYDNLDGDDDVFCLYNPYVSLKYRLGDSYRIQGSASVGNDVAGIDKMGQGYIFNGYRTLYSYQALQDMVLQNYSLSLNYSNYSSYLFASLGAIYNTMYSNLMPEYFYSPEYTFITYKEKGSHMRNFRAMMDVKKKFGDTFTLNGAVEYSYLQSEQFLQGKLFEFNNQGFTFRLGMDFYVGENFNVVYDGSYTVSKLGGGTASNYRNSVNDLTINWFPFENWSLVSRNYIYWNSKYEQTARPFMDLKVEWHATGKLLLNFQANNMLDIRAFEYSYFSGASEIKKTTSLKGTEWLLGVKVEF